MLALAVAGIAAVVARYRALAREHHAQTVALAADRERTRIAEEMHDALGHRLALVALRAAALQMTAAPAAAEAASELRHEADAAVTDLHRVLDVLRDDAPSPATVDELVARARAAGADVLRSGVRESGPAAPLARAVVREALTNALRHAPGETVRVDVGPAARGGLRVTVGNRLGERPASGSGRGDARRGDSGLALLERRVGAAGGGLAHGERDGSFVLEATLPPAPPDAGTHLPPARSPLAVLARQVVLPAAVAVVLVLGWYAWASRGATLEPEVFAAIGVGTVRAEVEPLLPERESWVRLVRPPAALPGWECSRYTEGNFPLALATLEVCFADGHVARLTDLREQSWW